jgi:hypothetical protein
MIRGRCCIIALLSRAVQEEGDANVLEPLTVVRHRFATPERGEFDGIAVVSTNEQAGQRDLGGRISIERVQEQAVYVANTWLEGLGGEYPYRFAGIELPPE